jgi:hypothetical protein
LSERELLFLDTLCEMKHGHCSESFLQLKLKDFEMELEEFKRIKKKLLYEGYIGIVYGNITLEKKMK